MKHLIKRGLGLTCLAWVYFKCCCWGWLNYGFNQVCLSGLPKLFYKNELKMINKYRVPISCALKFMRGLQKLIKKIMSAKIYFLCSKILTFKAQTWNNSKNMAFFKCLRMVYSIANVSQYKYMCTAYPISLIFTFFSVVIHL